MVWLLQLLHSIRMFLLDFRQDFSLLIEINSKKVPCFEFVVFRLFAHQMDKSRFLSLRN